MPISHIEELTAAHELHIAEIKDQYDQQLDKYESDELEGISKHQLDEKICKLQKELNDATKSAKSHKGKFMKILHSKPKPSFQISIFITIV